MQAPEAQDSAAKQHWYWKISLTLNKLLKRVAPPGSQRERVYRWLTWPIRGIFYYGVKGMLRATISGMMKSKPGKAVLRLVKSILPRPLKRFIGEFRKELRLPDHTQAILFADDSLLPEYQPRKALDTLQPVHPVKVSLIATIRNEAANIEAWLASLLQQSRLPDEIVITDGGSTDGSPDILRRQAVNFPVPIQVIDSPGANISRGRNIAIQHAKHEVVACADFGCILGQDWLHNLILPFEADQRVEVACGFFEPAPGKKFEHLAARYLIPSLDAVKPQDFLPSSRSLAFRKQVWERVGGYPEWLSFAGEDTLFDLYAKLHAGVWAFIPQAKVYWHAPANLKKLFQTQYRYSKGDGESGLFATRYWATVEDLLWRVGIAGVLFVILLMILVACWLLWGKWAAVGVAGLALLFGTFRFVRQLKQHAFNLRYLLMPAIVGWAQVRGYSAGVKARPQVTLRRADSYGLELQRILAAHPQQAGVIVYPPTHDWGYMFQLPQQMARVLARRGYLYFYCTNNEITDDVIGFRQVEPNLYVSYVPLETFRTLEQPIVYIGSPWHREALTLFNQPAVIYDYYDDLRVSSGRVEDFNALVEKADVVIVTAQRLLEDVQAKRPDALFVPNGVDLGYIQSRRPDFTQPAPDDWQPVRRSGKPIIGYSGSLAERFDYELLRYLLDNRTDVEFVLIGVSYDGSLERSGLLEAGYPNLHWLGMKPYHELFPYIWRFDVGIIPFKINQITMATTSIKLFEYMACEVPVVSTAMPESKRYPGVWIGEDYAQFSHLLDQALQAGDDSQYLATIRAVAQDRSWDKRAEAILHRLEKTRL